MTTTHLEAPTPRRAAARRSRRAAAIFVAATLMSLTPAPHVGAERAPERRGCATAGAATYTVVAGDSWFGIAPR